jgi:hypothetical protein
MFNLSRIIEEKTRDSNNSNNNNNNLNNNNNNLNNINNNSNNSGSKNITQNINFFNNDDKKKSYIEIPKNEWKYLPKKTYIRYTMLNSDELKHGGMISDIINENGDDIFLLYSKIGNYWKSWKLKFNTINKLYKLNKQNDANISQYDKNIGQQPIINNQLNQQQINQQQFSQQQLNQQQLFQPSLNQQQLNQQHIINNNQLSNPISIFQKTNLMPNYDSLLACQPIPLPNMNNDNKQYKTEIELLNKKIENLEITQQRLESDIKKIINILNKITNN